MMMPQARIIAVGWKPRVFQNLLMTKPLGIEILMLEVMGIIW
jgi:hypothetical protein